MTTVSEKGGDCAKKVVRMYPDNQLKAQVRSFESTAPLSAFHVIAAAIGRP
jgi:hypothetical protein